MRSPRWGWLLTGPHLLIAATFIYVPFAAVIAFSLTRYDGITRPGWVGLENYRWLVTNDTFRQTLWNTARLSFVVVVLTVVVSVPLAAAIHRARRLQALYRAIFLVPMVATPVASASVWRWFYRPDDGLINTVLRPIGVERIAWLSDAKTAVIALAIIQVWALSSFFVIVLLASLDNIPTELYEASSLDGAGTITQFRYITAPALRPMIWFTIIQSTLSTIQLYDVATVLSRRGGPGGSTRTLTMQLHDEAFVSLRMGRASAIGVAIFVISLSVTAVQLSIASESQWWRRYRRPRGRAGFAVEPLPPSLRISS